MIPSAVKQLVKQVLFFGKHFVRKYKKLAEMCILRFNLMCRFDLRNYPEFIFNVLHANTSCFCNLINTTIRPMVSTVFSNPCDLSVTKTTIPTRIVSKVLVLQEQTTVHMCFIQPFFSKSYITIFRKSFSF